jgi:hypothetical protein
LFAHRLALEVGEPDVESLKRRISRQQLARWMAFYRIEPWGQPWLRAGRQTELIRSAFGGKFDKHNEERFLITYQPGDEYRAKVHVPASVLAERLANLPGMKKTRRSWRQSARSRRSSPPARRG